MRRNKIAALVVVILVSAVAGYVYRSARSGRLADVAVDDAIDSPPAPNAVRTAKESPFRFELMTQQSGVDFVYYGAPGPQAYMTEQNGGGIALLDFDHDGRLDLFLVNGSDFQQPATGLDASNRLYRSMSDFQYADATQDTGLLAHGFGMGCAAGDYDNDGFTDLFVACYGRDRLWHSNGDGTFSESHGRGGGRQRKMGHQPGVSLTSTATDSRICTS